METDIRDTALYQEVSDLYQATRHPGSGLITDAATIDAAPDGRSAVFAGTMFDTLEGLPTTRICKVKLDQDQIQVLTFGPNSDRLPKYSPDGECIAFLSDREKPGDFQLYFLQLATGATTAAPVLDAGWVEYLHWSADGKRLLLGVAGHGADVGGAQGAVTSEQAEKSLPSWMPAVETGEEDYRWRSVWVYEMDSGEVRQVSGTGLNVWEAVWCGADAVAAVVSSAPGEGSWYTATLNIIDIDSGTDRLLYRPRDQLGQPCASPSGKTVAVVEAVCSDRGVVGGELLLIDTASGDIQRPDTQQMEVSFTHWQSETRLTLAGQRSFDTVIAAFDNAKAKFREIWVSEAICCGLPYAVVSPLRDGSDDCLLIGEGFLRAPEIAAVRKGVYSPLVSLDHGFSQRTADWVESVQAIRWPAPDGQEIQGWLIQPTTEGPHPLVMNVHGGPVWQWRPLWLGRGINMLMLLKHGYAVFLPNPRGSSGRGKDFTRQVIGDMGGGEATDHLAGLDYLVAEGIADAQRLGVTGGSHGGYMTSWIITQDERFAAAVPVAPVTNWVSMHLTSNLPSFCNMVLDGDFYGAGNHYFDRSPVMHAHKVKTPTLNICGALDRCTPPGQAMEFHNALLEHGVNSVLVTYPEEGHGVRRLPAPIDYVARLVGWFETHMTADG